MHPPQQQIHRPNGRSARRTATPRVLRSIACTTALCLAATALCVPASAHEPRPGGTLVVAGGAGMRHLNPAVQSGAHTGLGVQLFAGLVRVDGAFQPRPYCIVDPRIPAGTAATGRLR